MLENLLAIDWQNVQGCSGKPAITVPNLIEALVSDDAQVRKKAAFELEKTLTAVGYVADAASSAFPFLMELLDQPNLPSHAAILKIIHRLLKEAASYPSRYGTRHPIYDAIHAQQATFKQLADHQEVESRLTATSILCFFKEDTTQLIGWLLDKIRMERDSKGRGRLLLQATQAFSDDLSFNFYRPLYLEQAARCCAEKDAWLRVMGARAIIHINHDQTDPQIVDFLVNLIVEWSLSDPVLARLSDLERDFMGASLDFVHLGPERQIDAYLQLIERLTQLQVILWKTAELLSVIFEPNKPPTSFSIPQKAVLNLLLNKAEIWSDEAYPPFENYGLPTTRAEMQQLLASLKQSDAPHV